MRNESKSLVQFVPRQEFYWGLQQLADGLNRFKSNSSQMTRAAWKAWLSVQLVVQAVTSNSKWSEKKENKTHRMRLLGDDALKSLEVAAWQFNDTIAPYAKVTLQVSIRYRPKRKNARAFMDLVPSIAKLGMDKDRNPYRAPAILLWHYFFHWDGYERLKTCRCCGRWFVDHGRNKQAGHCPPDPETGIRTCLNSRWSRKERPAREREIELGQRKKNQRSRHRRRG